MSIKSKRAIEWSLTGVMLTISGVCLLTLVMLFSGGCSTVSGVGKLMQGIGNDIEDSAEGTRQRMKERG